MAARSEIDGWISDWKPPFHSVDYETGIVTLRVARSGNIEIGAPPTDPPEGVRARITNEGDGTLTLTGSWPEGTVFVPGERSLILGRNAVAIKDCEIVGPGSVVIPARSIVDGVSLQTGANGFKSPSLQIKDHAHVLNVSGLSQSIRAEQGAVLVGDERIGFHPQSLSAGGTQPEPLELDNLGLFRLTWESRLTLEASSRLHPWLPTRRVGTINRRLAYKDAY